MGSVFLEYVAKLENCNVKTCSNYGLTVSRATVIFTTEVESSTARTKEAKLDEDHESLFSIQTELVFSILD